MAIGFCVCERSRAVNEEMVARFKALPVANVSDAMSRMTAGGARLRPMHRDGGMAGPAVTVKTRPGDNLMVHKAIDMLVPGDVLVVDAGGDLTNALIGELMLAYAMKKGVAGIIIDGAIRDVDEIRRVNHPVYAAGVTHRGPYKDGPGEINVPIAIDGMVIHPGDLVLGDGDGIVVVPIDDVDAVYAKAAAKHDAETQQMKAIEAGTNDRSWVDEALKKAGCEMR